MGVGGVEVAGVGGVEDAARAGVLKVGAEREWVRGMMLSALALCSRVGRSFFAMGM